MLPIELFQIYCQPDRFQQPAFLFQVYHPACHCSHCHQCHGHDPHHRIYPGIPGMRFQIKCTVFQGISGCSILNPDKIEIAEEKPIPLNDTVLTVIKQDPAVESVFAYATKDAILKGPESFEGLKLKGVEPAYSFVHMKEFLKSGRWIHFPDSGYSNEINLSAYTANQLKLKTGDKLFTYFIQPDGSKRVRPHGGCRHI